MIAVVVLLAVVLGDHAPGSGPLRDRDFFDPDDTAGAVTGAKVFGRRAVTWRSAIITNPTDRPITLERVALVDPGSLRIADARAVLRRPDQEVGIAFRWPPTGQRVRPLRGTVVPPRSPTGLQLYLRVRLPEELFDGADRPNTATAIANTSGVRITYRYDGRQFETTISSVSLTMCTKDDACSPPVADGGFAADARRPRVG